MCETYAEIHTCVRTLCGRRLPWASARGAQCSVVPERAVSEPSARECATLERSRTAFAVFVVTDEYSRTDYSTGENRPQWHW